MARERDRDTKVLSAGLAIACHVGLGWWLLRPMPLQEEAPPETGLLVTWIEPRASASLSVPPPQPPDRGSPAQGRTLPAEAPQPLLHSTRADQRVESHHPGPATATLLEQGLEWARAQEEAPDFIPDPLREPPAPEAAGRFAMRDPISPEAVLRAIGKLVGGPDYETDPCPRIRRNLAALGPAGDSELMREEIRRLQSLCM